MSDNAVAPTAQSERIVALDVLRGVAVLGILSVNIQAFSMIDAAYFNPTAYADYTGINRLVHWVTYIFADQKFMTIFSMLFGAGIVLMGARADARGLSARNIHYRRMVVLLIFGAAHAYLLWHGDILTVYAMCGMLVYVFRKRPIRTQLILGLVMLAIASGLSILAGWSVPLWGEDQAREFVDQWAPGEAMVTAELNAMRGSWATQLGHRVEQSLEFHTFVFLWWGLWRAGGNMLIGMALFRSGVMNAERSMKFYCTLAVAGLGVGLPTIAYGLSTHLASGWEMTYVFFIGNQYNYWGSELVSLGWISIVILIVKSGRLEGFTTRLASVGRMAFTNYIAQTLMCTLLFYGHGLGLFGRMERWQQLAIVIAIWVVQLILSPIWLRLFRFGPLEWLWRTLTYRARPAFKQPSATTP